MPESWAPLPCNFFWIAFLYISRAHSVGKMILLPQDGGASPQTPFLWNQYVCTESKGLGLPLIGSVRLWVPEGRHKYTPERELTVLNEDPGCTSGPRAESPVIPVRKQNGETPGSVFGDPMASTGQWVGALSNRNRVTTVMGTGCPKFGALKTEGKSLPVKLKMSQKIREGNVNTREWTDSDWLPVSGLLFLPRGEQPTGTGPSDPECPGGWKCHHELQL